MYNTMIQNNIMNISAIKCWKELCYHAWSIHLLEQNTDKLDKDCWLELCSRKWTLDLLKKNTDKLLDNIIKTSIFFLKEIIQ